MQLTPNTWEVEPMEKNSPRHVSLPLSPPPPPLLENTPSTQKLYSLKTII